MAEKMRVHILAKELNVNSKAIIEKCRAEGIDSVKNHMSTLSAGLHATIMEWFSEGSHDTALETTDRIDLTKVRISHKLEADSGDEVPTESTEAGIDDADFAPAIDAFDAGKADEASDSTSGESSAALPPSALKRAPGKSDSDRPSVHDEHDPATSASPMESPPRKSGLDAAPARHVPDRTGVKQSAERESSHRSEESETLAPVKKIVASEPLVATVPDVQSTVAVAVVAESPSASVPKVVDKNTEALLVAGAKPVVPAGPQNIPVPAKLQGPRVVRYEAPEPVFTPRRGPVSSGGVGGLGVAGGVRPRPLEPTAGQVPVPAPGSAEAERAKKKARANPRRAAGRVAEAGERLAEWRDRDLLERQERLAGATGRRIQHRRSAPGPGGKHGAPVEPKNSVVVHEPIRVKEFCAVLGVNFIQLVKVLRDEHNQLATINGILQTETAHLLAIHFGKELEVVAAKTMLDDLEDERTSLPRTNLQPRPPVVTMLGHVDHGKTSLLDAIRRARVAVGEDGGITQHIGSYHLQTSHGPVTFLDTPGHEAFTAMRARGAQLTDVVVLVVAADDGVMPQTIEAINHAKAAGVPIVVALNKIDLGDQNRLKIYGQLTEHGLTPSGDWGGEVDVIPTSATSGVGVKELVEHLADLSGLLDLKADPTLPARGTVIEAEAKSGVGAVVRVLMHEGILKVGDTVVCGNAFGKVRAIISDRGEKMASVGPAIPAEVWGLDEVPLAGDRLYQVDSSQRAKDIAAETRKARVVSGRQQSMRSKSLEEMFRKRDTAEVPELNLIIKTDVDGSLSALKAILSEFPSTEVRLTIRHAGVGAVTDSDILLAATCGGIVVAFRVDTSVGARRLADQHGVDVRSYRVIYDVRDEIKKALEGLLAPEEKVESRGTLEVRQVFHISKVGKVAGSYATSGTIERGHLAKVIRNGVVVRAGAKFSSLRRFKDDVREVRLGMECGVRLEGFDDIHVADVIETYEIVKIARKL